MGAGDKSKRIITEVCKELKIPEIFSSTIPRTFKQDGLYCFREVNGSEFLTQQQMYTQKHKDSVIEKVSSWIDDYGIIDDFFSINKNMSVILDITIVNVLHNKIENISIYEIDGEGHRSPCFGDNPLGRFIDTVTSDAIKNQIECLTRIPYYDGNETLFYDILKQINKDFEIIHNL